MNPTRARFVTILATLLFTLAIGAVGPQLPAAAHGTEAECPTDTDFVAKYEVEGARTLAFESGSNVITFSDLQPATGDLKRVDFSSSVPIAYVYVKAGHDEDDSRAYDYRSSPVTSGDNLQAGGTNPKDISHITFCGPQTGSLGVMKYEDQNGNGHQDEGEGALAGWTFSIEDADGELVGTLTSGADGKALKTGLAPGTYSVTETLQAGFTNTDPGGGTVTGLHVTAGGSVTATFGNYRQPPADGYLRVLKYDDQDGDGVRDLPNGTSGEPGLSGWSFTVQRSPDSDPQTLTTGDDGYTGSVTLPAATYSVCEVTPLPEHWTNTDPGADLCKEIAVTAGELATAAFGNHFSAPPTDGTLAVFKYNDLDGDGQRDEGEGPLAGWTFTAKDASDATVGTMITEADGTDTLTLPAGTYSVVETPQVGWTSTRPAGGLATGLIVEVGQTTTATFGNYQIQKLTLTSMCSVDPSKTREWRVRNPNPVDVPFTWEVYGTAQEGAGTVLANSDKLFTTVTVSGPNTTKIYWNGGETVKASGGAACAPQTGSLTVLKYNDLNGDGERATPNGTAGEPGLSGWTFTLTRIYAEVSFQIAEPWDLITDTLGYSETLSLAPGAYRVCEDTPLATGWTNTDPGDGYCKTVELGAGATVTVEFGNHYSYTPPPQSFLSVTKYNDLDRDGTRDAGEPGLEGWVFEISSGGPVFATLVTGSLGTAAMNLGPGTYTVTEVPVQGWTNTDPAGATASKTATVVAGQTTSIAFGNARVIIPPTSQTQLFVFKYNDLNVNGHRDDDEAGLAGFTFLVRDASGATITTLVTDALGYASVTNLPLGAYTIVEQPRSGWANTDPGGAGQKSVVLTSTTTMVQVWFGNAEVRLPSTSTNEPPASAMPLLLVLAFLPELEVIRRLSAI